MPRILVVDDDVHMRAVLRQLLEEAGYRVVDAPDGNAAMRLCHEQPVDLVIIDILMPEKDNIETIIELQRDFPEVKIIAMSAGGDIGSENYLSSARKLGALHTFTKRTDCRQVLEGIRKLVGVGEG